MDDGLASKESAAEAIKLIAEARDICFNCGIRLHKFISNSREVLESVPLSERATDVKNLDMNFEDLPVERVLGIQWCVENDQFQFQMNLSDQPLTSWNFDNCSFSV